MPWGCTLVLTLLTVCAVAHLDASLRWHDGGASPSPSLFSLCALSRTLDASLRWHDGGASPSPLALLTVCAVAHLDASLRWHDGGASPSPSLSPPCALSRTWMPVFAGMTEGPHPHPRSPHCVRCRALWMPAFAGMTEGPHPHPSLSSLCALSRTWMPAFAGMTEGRHPVPPCRYPHPPPSLLQGRRDLSLRGGPRWRLWLHPHPNPLPEGEGIIHRGRDARFPPARERRGPPFPLIRPHPSSVVPARGAPRRERCLRRLRLLALWGRAWRGLPT